MLFRFGDCELDTDRAELRVAGEPRPVEPQVLGVLEVLVRNHERVVSKEELLDAVWHHRFVTESAISSRIKSVRQAIGDDGRAQRLIRTVHGRGYHFVAEVTEDGTGGTPARGAGTPLPRPVTPTIGRADAIAKVCALLEEAAVVTLLGPGGVGKTRLAVEAAARYVDGANPARDACFVDLTKVRDASLVPALVVQELGIHHSGETDAERTLEEALRGRELLLVLDNVEHVIDAAPVVADIVHRSPGVQVLATSRARLRVAGEQVFDVSPLEVESDAVALFAQSATAVDPDFQLDPNLADVVTICRTVDGLPLAIELAAGHVRTLPPPLLRTRLRARLGSPAGSVRDAPARQQTIRATIDWSLQLAGEAERRLFPRLGVFSGPVPLEAVEQVCAAGAEEHDDDIVDALTRLVDQSLVRRVAGPRGEARFVLLELLREHARELLDEREADAVAGRHAAYVDRFLAELDERRWGAASDRWIDLIAEQLGEIRAAHAWARAHGEVELAARLTAHLGTYWHREGYLTEGREWVHEALAHTDQLDEELVARVRLAAGFVEWPRDQRTARGHWQAAADAFRRLGSTRYLAYALGLVSGTYIGVREDYECGLQLCDEAIALAREVGEAPLIAQVLNVKGELARVQGDDALALEAYEEGITFAKAAGDDSHLSAFIANLSYLADHRGDYEEARRLGREALRLSWSLGRRMMAAWTVSELAGPELGLGRAEGAALLVGAADEALRLLGATRHPGDVPEHDRVVAGLRAALGDDEFERLCAEGARLSLADAIERALS